jgi:hypothetical protein
MARRAVKRSIAAMVVGSIAAGGVAAAHALDDSSGNRTSVENSCAAYVRSDPRPASGECADALKSGELSSITYGPGARP